MVETPVSFTGVEIVVGVVGGCFCGTSSTTFSLLGLVDFLARTFLLGAIWTVDDDGEDEEEEEGNWATTGENGRETERNREERETGSSNDRGILGRGK